MASDQALPFPADQACLLEPYLPGGLTSAGRDAKETSLQPDIPFVTLTYAASLDGAIAAAPGTRTILSGPQSKAMTHFLRTRHAAICVGVGTAEADDPGLNSRSALVPGPSSGSRPTGVRTGSELASGPVSQPRPIVIDPQARWAVSETSKVVRLAQEKNGLAPYVLTAVPLSSVPAAQRATLEGCGGKYIVLDAPDTDGTGRPRFRWRDMLAAVRHEGLESIMIEGGGHILESLLMPPNNELVRSVIVTVAPTWLGQGGMVVSPERRVQGEVPTPAPRLKDVSWLPLGEDVVLCGRLVR